MTKTLTIVLFFAVQQTRAAEPSPRPREERIVFFDTTPGEEFVSSMKRTMATVIGSLPPATQFDVYRIAKNSYGGSSEPMVSEFVPADPGRFGERSEEARLSIYDLFRARLKPSPAAGSDYFGAVAWLSDHVRACKDVRAHRVLFIGDGRQWTGRRGDIDLETPDEIDVDVMLKRVAALNPSNSLHGTNTTIGWFGCGYAPNKTASYSRQLKEFWREYFVTGVGVQIADDFGAMQPQVGARK